MIEAPQFPSPHRRYNPLTGEWVLVSAHRTDRPWLGGQEATTAERRPEHDPDCYLCPGSTRANGATNPDYDGTFVFTNDFPALLPEPEPKVDEASPLLRAERQAGTCRVICYSPRHDLDMASMDEGGIQAVIDVWAEQTAELSETYPWVQVFENRGAAMGASNPHPHGQIWAGSAVPVQAEREDSRQRDYFETENSLLLLDYVSQETGGERTIVSTDHWLAVVPYWAVWPFELLVIPRRAVGWLPDLAEHERSDLASVLSNVLSRYDAVFNSPFPYSMGWHGAPAPIADYPHWQLHLHFYPPLLRSATVRKHMVGYELLSEAQRDLTAETAAARLRSLDPQQS